MQNCNTNDVIDACDIAEGESTKQRLVQAYAESALQEALRKNPIGGARPSATLKAAGYRPYPTHCLPPVLKEFAEAVAASVGCDPCLAAMPALSLAGATAGASVVARIKESHKEPPLLWTLGIADSGSGKSPASQPSVMLAHRLTDGLDGVFDRAAVTYEDASARYAEELKAWKARKKAGGDPGEEPRRPKPPAKEYFVTTDATIERIIVDMQSSPRGLFLARDEFAGWFYGLTRYSQGGDDSPHWLSLFDGGAVSYRRRTGEPKEVRLSRTAVGLDGGIQPEVLAAVLKDPKFINSGMMARFLVAMPPKRVMKYSDADVGSGLIDAYYNVLVAIRGITHSPGIGPVNIGLAPNAHALFVAFYDDLNEQMAEIEGGPLPAAYSKMSKYAVRLALVHHVVTEAAANRDPGQTPIGTASMAAGIELARWHLGEAERLYAFAGCTEEERGTTRLLALVARKGGRITPRQLQRANGQMYPTADAARLALADLVEAKHGKWLVEGDRHTFVLTDENGDLEEGFATGDGDDVDSVGLSGVGSDAKPDSAYRAVGTVG